MNATNLVRPIRSIKRFRLGESSTERSTADLLRAILEPVDGGERRCAANVVVFGGDSEAANEFAVKALEYLEPLDSLWRVGNKRNDAESREVWVPENDRLLSMLSARVVFIPADDRHKNLFAEWQERADFTFVGPGPYAKQFSTFQSDRRRLWQEEEVTAAPPPRWDIDPVLARTSPYPVAAAYARLNVSGDAFSDFTLECWSDDRRVHAMLVGTQGGALSVIFTSTDLSLTGARVDFRLVTSSGARLQGEKHLWPDGADPERLIGAWTGNQLDFDQRQAAGHLESPHEVKLMLEFEVHSPA
jgi:hypothetical protein